MKNLSKELGISEPAIYRHFESKQKILISVLDSFQHQNKIIHENFRLEGETSFNHLQRSIQMIMHRLNNNPAMSAVIFSEEIFQGENELSEIVTKLMNSTTEFFTNLIALGQKDNSIRSDVTKEDLSIIVSGSLRHIVTVWRMSGFAIDLRESGKKLAKTLETVIGT